MHLFFFLHAALTQIRVSNDNVIFKLSEAHDPISPQREGTCFFFFFEKLRSCRKINWFKESLLLFDKNVMAVENNKLHMLNCKAQKWKFLFS